MWNNNESPGFRWRPRLKIYTDGQNNQFDLDSFEARSYGHWLYCTKIKGKVVFNDYYYSQTTGYHQSHMRDLLKKLKFKIDVVVNVRHSLCALNGKYGYAGDHCALAEVYEDLIEAEIKASRARGEGIYIERIRKHFSTHAKAIEYMRNEIKVLRSLGAKMSRDRIKEMKTNLIKADAERRESLRHASKEARERRKNQVKELKSRLVDLSPVKTVFERVDNFNAISMAE